MKICSNCKDRPLSKYSRFLCDVCIEEFLDKGREVSRILREQEELEYLDFVKNRWNRYLTNYSQFRQFSDKGKLFSGFTKEALKAFNNRVKNFDIDNIYINQPMYIFNNTTINKFSLAYIIARYLFFQYYKSKLQSRFSFSLMDLSHIEPFKNDIFDNYLNIAWVYIYNYELIKGDKEREYMYRWLTNRVDIGLPFIFHCLYSLDELVKKDKKLYNILTSSAISEVGLVDLC